MTSRIISRAAVVAVAGLVLVGCAPGQNNERGADWATYPAHANVPAATVLAGATESELVSRGKQVLGETRDALTAEYGLAEWDSPQPEHWQAFGGNGYGGTSLLSSYIAPTWQLEIQLPESEWDNVVDVVAGIAAAHEMDPLNRDEEIPSEWMALGSFRGDLDFLEVVVQDARLNDEELALAESEGLLVTGITISYGGTTVRDAERQAFTNAADEFAGLELPPATSD